MEAVVRNDLGEELDRSLITIVEEPNGAKHYVFDHGLNMGDGDTLTCEGITPNLNPAGIG
uniref:Uncharacterized protein n=1 Tax=viral metagenome TaxID=1070528 RepID=A0A6M3JM46_9ZZZZ